MLSCFSHVWLFATPWTVACQPPLSMEFSRQEYCSELPFPLPGDLPDLGMEPEYPASPVLSGKENFECHPRDQNGTQWLWFTSFDFVSSSISTREESGVVWSLHKAGHEGHSCSAHLIQCLKLSSSLWAQIPLKWRATLRATKTFWKYHLESTTAFCFYSVSATWKKHLQCQNPCGLPCPDKWVCPIASTSHHKRRFLCGCL